MTGTPGYSYSSSVKSDVSDELINTLALRPLAGLLVRVLYPTPVTPNQVTIAAILAGLCSAVLYGAGTVPGTAAAGLLLTLKDLLDSADGQLARAKRRFSRRGRFLDSLGDILVNAAVFLAIGIALHRAGWSGGIFVLAAAAFLSLTLRVSYHVFYQVSYLRLRQAAHVNRTIEEVQEEDRRGDRLALRLQRIFLVLYGWQDRLMAAIDAWSRRGTPLPDEAWFGDRAALRWSGFLGLGTELFLLTVCSLCDALPTYLALNLAGMNLVWAGCVAYRKWGIAKK